jgi:hypothetical protein
MCRRDAGEERRRLPSARTKEQDETCRFKIAPKITFCLSGGLIRANFQERQLRRRKKSVEIFSFELFPVVLARHPLSLFSSVALHFHHTAGSHFANCLACCRWNRRRRYSVQMLTQQLNSVLRSRRIIGGSG